MKECCANCKLKFEAHKTDFRKLKTDDPIDYELDGFICMGLGYERVATWIVGLDAETGLCEEFIPKESECDA